FGFHHISDTSIVGGGAAEARLTRRANAAVTANAKRFMVSSGGVVHVTGILSLESPRVAIIWSDPAPVALNIVGFAERILYTGRCLLVRVLACRSSSVLSRGLIFSEPGLLLPLTRLPGLTINFTHPAQKPRLTPRCDRFRAFRQLP